MDALPVFNEWVADIRLKEWRRSTLTPDGWRLDIERFDDGGPGEARFCAAIDQGVFRHDQLTAYFG